MAKKTFGSFIKTARLNSSIGQRELARGVGVSPAYLNDIEQDKRAAPSVAVLNLIKSYLKIEDDLFFDLAGQSKKKIPPDVEAFLLSNEAAIATARMLKNLKFSEEKIMELKNMIASQIIRQLLLRLDWVLGSMN